MPICAAAAELSLRAAGRSRERYVKVTVRPGRSPLRCSIAGFAVLQRRQNPILARSKYIRERTSNSAIGKLTLRATIEFDIFAGYAKRL
jgi:hypothetical protein